MTTKQLNLRWHCHTNNLQQVFTQHFNNEMLVDVTLSCEGRFLKAHRIVLSACSSYFQTLFTLHQVQHPVIVFSGIKFQELKYVVEYMYRGEVKILDTELDGVLCAAEVLRVKGLSKIRPQKDEIIKNMPQGNATLTNLSEDNRVVEDGGGEQTKIVFPKIVPKIVPDKLIANNKPIEDEKVTNNKNPNQSLSIKKVMNISNQRKSNSSKSCSQKNDSVLTKDGPNNKTVVVFTNKPFAINKNKSGNKQPQEDEQAALEKISSFKMSNDDNYDDDDSQPNSYTEKNRDSFASSSKLVIDMKKGKDIKKTPLVFKGVLKTPFAPPVRQSNRLRNKNPTRCGKIPRPPNAFMIFANQWRRELAKQHPGENNVAISVRLGQLWKNMNDEEKAMFYDHARLVSEAHKRKYPDYHYSPKEARLKKKMKEKLAKAETMRIRTNNTPFTFVKVSMDEPLENESLHSLPLKKTKYNDMETLSGNDDGDDNDDLSECESRSKNPESYEDQFPDDIIPIDHVKIETKDYSDNEEV